MRVGDLADLADGAGRAGQRRGVERLDRVDHADLRALGLERREHGVEVGLGEHRDVERRRGRRRRSARRRIWAADSSPET